MAFKQLVSAIGLSVGLGVMALPSQAQFESTGLGEIDSWGIGGLSQADGALPVTLWQNSSAETLEPLFARINPRGLTPTTRDLLTRILLSPSRAPTGEKADRLMQQRMRLIWELGELDAYVDIARQLPEQENVKSGTHAQIETQFLKGNFASACSQARSVAETSAFMFQARATCFALENNFDSTDLAMELGQEFEASDPWLIRAFSAMRTMPENPEERDEDELPAANFSTGITTALSLEAGFPVELDEISGTNPGIARQVALRDGVPRDVRIAMARLAAFAGLMTAEELRNAYRLDPEPLPEPEAEPDEPSEVVEEVDEPPELTLRDPVDPLDEALQTAFHPDATPEEIVRAARRALILVQSDPSRFSITAGVLTPVITRFRDPEAIGDNSEFFAIAAFAAGEVSLANRIQTMSLREGGPEENPYFQAWLDGLKVVTGADRSPASSRTVSDRLAEHTPSGGRSKALQMMLTFMTFDLPISPGAHEFAAGPSGDLISTGTSVSGKDMFLIESGMASSSYGEAFLRIIRVVGQRPDTVQALDMAALISLLQDAGYDAEARTLALEALAFQKPVN
ncbi:MAG: hypothetical protein CMK07_08135 [Ponticaulis sp.]|nr:hypothetical protein [Ponticaulis sp.]